PFAAHADRFRASGTPAETHLPLSKRVVDVPRSPGRRTHEQSGRASVACRGDLAEADVRQSHESGRQAVGNDDDSDRDGEAPGTERAQVSRGALHEVVE